MKLNIYKRFALKRFKITHTTDHVCTRLKPTKLKFDLFQVTDVTSRSVTLQWSPPSDTGGVELTGYIIEKMLVESEKWEKAATVEPSVTLFTVDNLKVHRHSAISKQRTTDTTASEINVKPLSNVKPNKVPENAEMDCFKLF